MGSQNNDFTCFRPSAPPPLYPPIADIFRLRSRECGGVFIVTPMIRKMAPINTTIGKTLKNSTSVCSKTAPTIFPKLSQNVAGVKSYRENQKNLGVPRVVWGLRGAKVETDPPRISAPGGRRPPKFFLEVQGFNCGSRAKNYGPCPITPSPRIFGDERVEILAPPWILPSYGTPSPQNLHKNSSSPGLLWTKIFRPWGR
jgi:hypothetical protein